MPMRINCPNCGKQFSAWDDLVGKSVECPKCHQKTVIGSPNEALESPPATKSTVKPAAPSTPLPAQPIKGRTSPSAVPQSAKPAAVSPIAGKSPSAAKHAVPPPPPRATPLSKAAPITAPRPRTSPDLDDDDSLPNGCPNCNATMKPNDDLCDACGYHLVLKKVIDISDMPKRNQSVGFERLLKEQLHDPESTSNTLLWVKIVGSLFLVGILFMCLGKWWWVGVLVAAGIGGLYWMKQRQQAADGPAGSEVNRDPVSLFVWSILLTVQRVIGWRKLEWPFPKARLLILCDPSFNDAELAGLERLNDLEAMDLQGTGITDAALDHLRPLKQLRFLVLRRTNVTTSAAQRLQQDLPKTMIWF